MSVLGRTGVAKYSVAAPRAVEFAMSNCLSVQLFCTAVVCGGGKWPLVSCSNASASCDGLWKWCERAETGAVIVLQGAFYQTADVEQGRCAKLGIYRCYLRRDVIHPARTMFAISFGERLFSGAI